MAVPAAGAAIPAAFDSELPCVPQGDGKRLCTGVVDSFDGAPVDVKLLLPPDPGAASPDADYPLVMGFHGWGGTKNEYNLNRWVNRGYAAFSMSDRGWGMSCGATDGKRLTPACTGVGSGASEGGYNHLMDTRFEVRDAQVMVGRLVDDGIVDPDGIGATGPSYGGGISMALAALNDRMMLGALTGEPNGELVPWRSDRGIPLRIAAAAPEIPWTDLAYSLVPNGSTLDYAVDSDYDQRPIGVMKQSYVGGLYAVGVAVSNFAPVGTDPTADVNGWFARLTAGEPYEGDPTAQSIVDEVTRFHSSYYIDSSIPPSPLLISNGWTDDLFPVDEAVRFYNRTRGEHPGAAISMLHFDHGHARGQNKGADAARLDARQHEWFDWYLKGEGAEPLDQVETLTQACPRETASGGPFSADNWADLAPGEVRFESTAQQVIAPEAGDPEADQAFDPIAGGGACSTAAAGDSLGVANYRLDPAPAEGYTLMGSPTIVADVRSTGPSSQLVSRLLDVDPSSGEETLVARGIYRPELSPTGGVRQVFQLHPNGYELAAGHVAKLELLPSDAPYARKSNGQAPITISNLDLRLPVLEEPGAPAVTEPVPKVVPPGYQLSSDYGAPADGDADGDGIPDREDDCVDQPGPAGPPGSNGCPLPDRDGDGVPDADDACPDQPGPATNDGCPETPAENDADGDGVLDSEDACPDTPGPASNAGCPLPAGVDRDGDGVRDSEDRCPDVAGPASNDGCPVTGPGPDPAPCSQVTRGTNGNDRIVGTPLSDRILGGRGADRIKGRGGDDCISGQAGRDRINGGVGSDEIAGGNGGDRIWARDGERDTIKCGKGRDRVLADELDRVHRDCEIVRRR